MDMRRGEEEPSELDAGLVPMEEEREGKRMHGVSLRPPSMLSSLCLQDFGICTDSLCRLLRFWDAFSPRLLSFSSKCFFSLAQTLHVADKVRPAESHQRIQLGLSSQAGNSDWRGRNIECQWKWSSLLWLLPVLTAPALSPTAPHSPLWTNPVFFFCT